MNAWKFQDSRQKKKLGEDKCPWSVGWYFEGKKQSKRVGSKSMAEKFRKKTEGRTGCRSLQATRPEELGGVSKGVHRENRAGLGNRDPRSGQVNPG